MASPFLSARAEVDLSENMGSSVVVAAIIVTILSMMHVAARLVSMNMTKMGFGISEGCIIFSTATTPIMAAMCFWYVSLGGGKHVQLVSPENLNKIFISVFVSEIAYTLSLVSTKISILFLYARIFSQDRKLKMWSYIIAAFVFAWGIAVFLVSVFFCKPVNGFWNQTSVPPPKCIDIEKFYVGNSIPNIVMDVAILFLPVSSALQLQMSRKSKIAVCGMFLLGGIVVIASCIRLKYIFALDTSDPTYSFTNTYTWSTVEMNVAIISACLPTMRPILSRMFTSVTGITSSGNAAGQSRSYDNLSYPRQGRVRSTLDTEELDVLPKHAQGGEGLRGYENKIKAETTISVY